MPVGLPRCGLAGGVGSSDEEQLQLKHPVLLLPSLLLLLLCSSHEAMNQNGYRLLFVCMQTRVLACVRGHAHQRACMRACVRAR